MKKFVKQYNINNLNNNLFKVLNRTYASLHSIDSLVARANPLDKRNDASFEVHFLEWFVGFSDAESSFIVLVIKDNNFKVG